MSSNLGIWDKLTKAVLFLVLVATVLAGVLAVVFWYVPLIKQNERMRKEIIRLNDQIELEEKRSAQMRAEIDALRNDPKAVERLAREVLSVGKPGETIIRFYEPPTNAATGRP